MLMFYVEDIKMYILISTCLWIFTDFVGPEYVRSMLLFWVLTRIFCLDEQMEMLFKIQFHGHQLTACLLNVQSHIARQVFNQVKRVLVILLFIKMESIGGLW